jgi:hypothetical protein
MRQQCKSRNNLRNASPAVTVTARGTATTATSTAATTATSTATLGDITTGEIAESLATAAVLIGTCVAIPEV